MSGSRLRRALGAVGGAALGAAVALVPMASASGATSGHGGSLEARPVSSGIPAFMTRLLDLQLHGGYVAAGAAMRDLGHGTVHLTGIPAGSTVTDAYLLWDVLDGTAPPPALRAAVTTTVLAHGTFDGTRITGTSVGIGDSPCWTATANYAYEADVTTLVSGNGTYRLSGFASGTTSGGTPLVVPPVLPLLEGASLVVVYQNASSATTDVQLYAGATESGTGSRLTLTMTGLTVGSTPTAKTTFIVADGQTYPDTGGSFNGTQVVATFAGATPQTAPTYATGNLWDTATATVSTLVSTGETTATASIDGTGDCLVWVGQALSTTTTVVTRTPGTPPAHHEAPPPVRIWGSDAVGTSIAASQRAFGSHAAGAVVLARSDFFSDALTGGPLAAALHAPLLLTPGASQASTLDPRVAAEIRRVLAPGGTVDILGGPDALSTGIDAQLTAMGYVPHRVAGVNEYGTAVAVAEALGNPSTIFETTGRTFADSLSAAPAAVKEHGAILLTDGSSQSPTTAAYLAAHPGDTRYAVGGPLAAAGADPSATAVWGQTAPGTSAAVATRFFPHAATFGVATDAPDSMTGGVFVSIDGRSGPMLVVSPFPPLNHAVAAYLAHLGLTTQGYVFGGSLATPPSVVAAVRAAVG